MESYQFVLMAIVTLAAAYIQSVTGFGFGIFAMIFFPGLMAYTEANALSTMLSALVSLFVCLAYFRRIDWRNLIFPLLGCLLSTYLAVYFIKTQKNETMMLMLGIVLFVLSLYFFFFSGRIRIRPTWYAGLIAGTVSGIMSGMFSIGGPPVVIYFLQSEKDSEQYMGTLSAYFICSGIIAMASKVMAGFVTANVWLCCAIGALGMLFGSFLGKTTRKLIKPAMVKKAVYGVMALSGLIYIVQAVL